MNKERPKAAAARPLLFGDSFTILLRLRILGINGGVPEEQICMMVGPRLPVLELYTNLTVSGFSGQSLISRL